MIIRNCVRPFLASLLLCLVASASFAGTVTGTVRNGTTGKPAAGVDVILIQLQGTMQPVATTKTDANGQYKFDNPALGQGPMLIRAVYRGVNYHEPATPDKTTVDIEVFEPTDKASAFKVTIHAIIVQPDGNSLMVGEEYRVSNKTQPPVAYYRADGSFRFSLPDGAQLTDVSAVGTSGMPVIQQTIEKGKNERAIVYPFRPGDSDVRISYRLPYPGNQTQLHIASPYAADQVGIFVPPTVQVSGGGFAPAGQEQGLNAYVRQTVPAGTPISVAISGTAPPPAQDNAGAGGNAGGGAGDETQNPGVNSRVETGAAPVASVTSLPARLDSVKWYVVAGFIAIFALGLVYVWRQPQVAIAGASNETTAASKRAAAETPVRAATAAEAASASGRAAANVEREVRGSLDELKDTLFRLELRREAGTITEEDYARERDRIKKVLHDLVKG
jgi:hypothetical protein